MLRKPLTLALITLWIGTAVSINPPGLFIDKMYDQQVECGRGKECRNFPANCLDNDSCQGGFSIGPILGDPDKDEAADVTVFEIYFRRNAELTNDTYGAIKLLDEKTGENTYRICFPKRKAAFAASEDDSDNQILVVDTAKPLIYKETITGEGIVSCVFFEFSNPLEFSAARKSSEIVFGEMSDSVMSTEGSETTSRRQNMQIAGEGEVEEKDKVVVVSEVKKEKEQKAVIEVPQEKESPVEEPQEIISTTEATRVTKPTIKPTTIVPVKKETAPTKPAQTKTITTTPIPVKSTTRASSLAAMMANIEKEKKETELKEKKVIISETEVDEDIPSDEGDVDTVIDEVVEEELVEETKIEKPTPNKERKRVEESDESDSEENKDTVVDKKKTGKASDQETLDKIVEERIEKFRKKEELEQMKREKIKKQKKQTRFEQEKSKETAVTKKSPISHTKMDEGAIKRKQLERKVEMRALDDSEPIDDEKEEEEDDMKQDRALDIEVDEELKDKSKKDGSLLKVSDKKMEKKIEVEEEKTVKKTTAKPDPKQKHPKDVRPKKDEDTERVTNYRKSTEKLAIKCENEEDNEDDDDAATHLSTMVGILAPFVVYMVL